MIVDAMSGPIPTPDAYGAPERGLARLRGYREHFMGEPRVRSHAEMGSAMDAAYDAGAARALDEETYLAEIDRAGIDVSAVFTENYETRLGVSGTSNEELSGWVARHPDRFIGIGGVDPWQDDAVRVVERAKELGLKALLISPFKQGLDATDPRLSRVFARCESIGLPVYVHCGMNWFAETPYDLGHPRSIDAVATGFPHLKLIAVHAGWPWVLDMMLIAWRHENVFVDISAHRPRHFTIPSSGWAPLLHFGARMIADRVLFGTTWTLLRTPPGQLLEEARDLPLPPDVLALWLGGNAARLFELV